MSVSDRLTGSFEWRYLALLRQGLFGSTSKGVTWLSFERHYLALVRKVLFGVSVRKALLGSPVVREAGVPLLMHSAPFARAWIDFPIAGNERKAVLPGSPSKGLVWLFRTKGAIWLPGGEGGGRAPIDTLGSLSKGLILSNGHSLALSEKACLVFRS